MHLVAFHYKNTHCVPIATEPGISLIILPLMRILQRLQTHATDTRYRHTLQAHATDTHYRHTLQTHCRHILQTHTTDTRYRHTLQTHATDTRHRHTLQTHTTDTFLFISHTTNVLLLKFRCNIFIGVRIIKEMPGFGSEWDTLYHDARSSECQNLQTYYRLTSETTDVQLVHTAQTCSI